MKDLSTYFLVVDGQTEIRSLNLKFERHSIKKPALRKGGCNGKTVTPEGYASAASGTLVVGLTGSWLHIVCVLDRENRSMAADAFATRVRTAVIAELEKKVSFKRADLEAKISVCVADRMFENWILADVEGIKQKEDLVKDVAIQKSYEGLNGATELGRIMKTSYRKTLHAPILFGAVSFARAKLNSVSFVTFADLLGL